MTKILVVFLSLLTLSAAKYPGKLYNEDWGMYLMLKNILNMTALMVKDSQLKLRQADAIQDNYKKNPTYDLGLLAGGITEKFAEMVNIYKHYSNFQEFKSNKIPFDNYLNGYHVVQSLYTQLRMESDLFEEAVEERSHKMSDEDIFIAEYAKTHPGLDVKTIKEARDKGLIPQEDIDAFMAKQNKTKKDTKGPPGLRRSMRVNLKEKLQERNGTEWSKRVQGAPEEYAYKKKLRYIIWAEKWKGFNPETEGVHIPDEVARAGLLNASEFSMKEFQGIF